MEANFDKKDTVRAHWLFFGIIIMITVFSTGLKFRIWTSDGIFRTTRSESVVVAYVQDIKDPATTYTVLATGHSDDIITHFPKYMPWEGQRVNMVRFYMETNTKKWPYISWVTPTTINITHNAGVFGLVADESGRTENMGYVRNSPDHRYVIPVDNKTPHYRSISLGRLPEVGDTISFWYVEIFLSRESFLKLAILY